MRRGALEAWRSQQGRCASFDRAETGAGTLPRDVDRERYVPFVKAVREAAYAVSANDD